MAHLVQEECVQTLTAKGLLRLSQIKTLYIKLARPPCPHILLIECLM